MNMKLQNAQNLKTCQEHREDEALVWILHKIMKIIFSQLIFFVCCFISFLPARVAVNSIVQKKAYLCLRLVCTNGKQQLYTQS